MPRKKLYKRKFRLKKGSYNTKPELQVKAILEELGIVYQQQFPIQRKLYDFYLPKYNVLLEVDGVYWHSNLPYGDMNATQKRNYQNDLYKDGLATINGYIICRIREDEISKTKIKQLLKG